MTGRLNIAIVPAWYPSPENPVAGIFVRDQARAAALLHNVTVVAPYSAAAPVTADEHGVRVVRLPLTRGVGRSMRGLYQYRAMSVAVARLRREGLAPDVVHAHVFSAGFFAVLVGRRRRIPVVVTEHHSDVVEGRLVGMGARVARFTYRHADLVCPVSSLLERSLLLFEPGARTEVVANVVDVDAFAGAMRPRGASRPASRLLAVASLDRYKALPFLLDAVRLLLDRRPDITLEIIGEGPDRAELERLAVGLPVTFLGARDRHEIAIRMQHADVFAQPSLVETFGIAAVEALAAGLPVVCTSACGVADLVAAHGGLVVPPANAAALGNAIATLLDNVEGVPPQTVDELRRDYGPEALAEHWDSIYRSLLYPTRQMAGTKGGS